MYIPPPATYANNIHNTKGIDIKHFIKWTAIEESSLTYISGQSKINANILGI